MNWAVPPHADEIMAIARPLMSRWLQQCRDLSEIVARIMDLEDDRALETLFAELPDLSHIEPPLLEELAFGAITWETLIGVLRRESSKLTLRHNLLVQAGRWLGNLASTE
jgi:hypothetical protein